MSTSSKDESVKVAIRIRPLNKREIELKSAICVSSTDNVLTIKKEKDAKEFIFDHVFDIDSRQEIIYESCAFNIVENSLEGFNGTVFAYGQTGAGKTFTMIGDLIDGEMKGIIPRTFDHIIQSIQISEDRSYVVRASFLEIYNEDVIDLLEEKVKTGPVKKEVHENPTKGVYIKDLKMIPVKSVEEMFKILDVGNKNRTMHATAMNATSSRSHAIFTVHVESLEGKEKVKSSKINLVDLAGSERQVKTQATGDRLKEGAKINLSLTALGNVINALVDGKKGGHIPYRDSKLTRLLQDSLGGNSKTLMIASISPAADNYEETVSTLRYAARARNIKNKPKINEDPKDTMIKEYLLEIEKLKEELLGKGGIGNNGEEFNKVRKEHEEKSKELMQKEEEMREMREKLREMEELILKKEEVTSDVVKARKLKKKKIQKQEQLAEMLLKEIEVEENKLLGEEEDTNVGKSIEDREQYWKVLAHKLSDKLKRAIKDREDLCKEFEVDREDLNVTIRDLESELSLYKQITEKFVTVEQIAILRSNSEYDEEKREYILVPFLMREESLSLPKSLRAYEVEDLWDEKRKSLKLELLNERIEELVEPPQKVYYKEMKGNPFIQNRKILKNVDYTNAIYQEKQYNVDGEQMFERTNYRFYDRSHSKDKSKDRDKDRSGSKGKIKLGPLEHRPTSAGKETLSPSRQISQEGKRKLHALPPLPKKEI